ncbi:tachylectin-related carbohydrate-binding protein [Streptomyces sp. NPDC001027]|uniref:tachylectin-related carbohydrate-binding protein n=1 Tax=Streptomyces sp. NPDC001027 TaxID=3154771 RepID=UPI00331E10C0
MTDGSTVAIYGITPEGELRWYRHDGWQDGTASWTAGQGGVRVSGGWDIYTTVFGGGEGVIYGITPEGELRWYRHDGWQDGTASWTAGQGGVRVSGGWDAYTTVFSGGEGVIYGITPEGELRWYRHDGWQDGTPSWTAGQGGVRVSGGWDIYTTVFSGGEGVIYGITPEGELRWYRHDGWQDGTPSWTAGQGGNLISGGWNIYSKVFGGGEGVIYAVTPEGQLRWYRHDGWQDGTASWTAGQGGNLLSGGWNIYTTVFGDSAVGHPRGVLPIGDIFYQCSRFGADGVLRVADEGTVSVDSEERMSISGPAMPGETFSWQWSLLDESKTLRFRRGEYSITADGRAQVAIVNLGGSLDGKKLSAKGHAEVVTAKVEGSTSVTVPGGSAGAGGIAVGPSAHTDVEISPDGAGVEVGASAGTIGGHTEITIGGQKYGTGVELGLKAEAGIHWGPTSTIKLPVITVSGPNPMAGVTSFVTHAVTDFARDPIKTSEETLGDILGAGKDAADAVGQVVELGEDLVGLAKNIFQVDNDDSNIVTSSQTSGFRPKTLPPGAGIID